MDIVSKQELISALTGSNTDLSMDKIERFVDLVLKEIATALICGDRVELRGFGSLVVRKRDKRIARNPKSGEKVETGDTGCLYFRASKELVRSLNVTLANDNNNFSLDN